MTPTTPHRPVLAEAIRDLPGGLVAVPATPSEVPAVTAVVRAVEIAATGTSSSNDLENADWLGDPQCRWGEGAAVVRRGPDTVAVAVTYDSLALDHSWWTGVFVLPGDPDARALTKALLRQTVAEGRARWAGLPGEHHPVDLSPRVTSACLAGETELAADLAGLGFAEVRRFWRMRRDHDSPQTPVAAPPGVVLREFDAENEEDWSAVHAAHMAAFAGHYDFTPVDLATWREEVACGSFDPTAWTLATADGGIVGYALGTDRYADEGQGYIARLGVSASHRGRGIARAVLHQRFGDDAARGRTATLLHVDSTNPTGATALYTSVGMRADQEHVWFARPLFD